MRPLVWFRGDLRTGDHPALYHAARMAERGVVAVFVVCAEQWREHDWGAMRVDLVRRTLIALSRGLETLNIPLLLASTPRFSGVPEVLLEIARRHDCDRLFYHRELPVDERRRDLAVDAAFEEAGLGVDAYDDQTVVLPQRIRTGEGQPYSVFTPFFRTWLRRLDEKAPTPLPTPRRQPELACALDDIPEALADFPADGGRPDLWPAGEKAALDRLERFLDGSAARYPDRRDRPAIAGTSLMSPALAVGAVSARQCLAAAAVRNRGELEGGRPGVAAWIRQLAWRDFYRHVLVGFPRVSKNRPFKKDTERLLWRDDDGQLAAWSEGHTGYPIVDAGMRQLARSGFMHNRLRMITAMFLSKHLLLDWRRGERHFMRHLVDGDLANNNGGWQWSASTGTDAAPYFRVFNPWTQGKKHDTDAAYIRRFVPELTDAPAAAVHDPDRLADWLKAHPSVDYPPPIVDHAAARKRAIELFRG